MCVWLLYLLSLQWRSSRGCHGPVDGPPTQPACLHHNRNMACVCISEYRNFFFFFCKLSRLYIRLADVTLQYTCVYSLSWLEEVEQCITVSLYGGRELLFILRALSEKGCPFFPHSEHLRLSHKQTAACAAATACFVEKSTQMNVVMCNFDM